MATSARHASSPEDIFAAVVKIVADTKKISPADIGAESTFDDLSISSLDALNILFGIEEHFGIVVSDEDTWTLRSISAVVAKIAEILPAPQASTP
jgi:acyl carrier protein